MTDQDTTPQGSTPKDPTAKGRASKQAAEKVWRREMELAERRGAERVRQQLREMVEDRKRIVRQGEQQVEVVEVSAVEELLDRED